MRGFDSGRFHAAFQTRHLPDALQINRIMLRDFAQADAGVQVEGAFEQ